MKKIPINKLEEGEFYYFESSSAYIFRLREVKKNGKIYCSGHIYLEENEFCSPCYLTTYGDCDILRLATEEEKKWLTTCLAENRFIDRSSIPKEPTINNNYSLY